MKKSSVFDKPSERESDPARQATQQPISSPGMGWHSTNALMKSLRASCSQLFALVLIFLRELVTSIRSGLDSSVGTASRLPDTTEDSEMGPDWLGTIFSELEHSPLEHLNTQPMTEGHSSGNSHKKESFRLPLLNEIRSVAVQNAPRSGLSGTSTSRVGLQTGLLFVGRIAWLLRIRKSFLEIIFRPERFVEFTEENHQDAVGLDAVRMRSGSEDYSSLLLPGLSASASFSAKPAPQESLLCSKDQLQSAFELSDADGDGFVSHIEALEVFLVL